MTFGILLRAGAALTLALRGRPTVVLLDVSLPIINSIAALGSVRLFIVSAHTSESLEERARGGGREVWLTSCDHRIMHLSNSASPRNIRVLVAEDDDDFRGLVVASLREDGYDVIEARNGDELLELITPPVLFNPPDAIVADVRMPGVDGLSVTAGLRGTGWATPIILMTAHANDDVCARAKELRADGLFQKPFEMRDLRRELRRLVQGTGGWRSAAPTLPDIS